MSSWSFTIITINFLIVFKDFLAKFIITSTLKDNRATWLRLVEGHLASHHDLVSVKVEHTICSRIFYIRNLVPCTATTRAAHIRRITRIDGLDLANSTNFAKEPLDFFGISPAVPSSLGPRSLPPSNLSPQSLLSLCSLLASSAGVPLSSPRLSPFPSHSATAHRPTCR
jgi:hypothetical protein